MTVRNQRLAFTLWMAGLSTVFGTAVAAHRYGLQTDIATDLIKIAFVIAVGCAAIAFTVWTVVARREKPHPWRGALAGGLTALAVLPLPFFVSKFKSEFLSALRSGETGGIEAFTLAFLPAIKTGTAIYVDMTKVTLLATLLSMTLGAFVAARSRT